MSRFVHHDYRDAGSEMNHLVMLADPPANWTTFIAEVNAWCAEQFGPPFDSQRAAVEGDRWSQRYESWVFCRDHDLIAFKLRWF